jgi:C4-dicarboxylate transporter DctQ subunit
MLENFEKVLANFCLAFLVILLGLQVFFRYFLHLGLSWSEELSRFSFIWFVYITGSLAAQKGTHIRVTAAVGLLPERGQKYARLAADVIWVLFNAAIVVSGFLLVQSMLTYPMFSASLYISMAYIYMVIPAAHVLMIIRIMEGYWKKSGVPSGAS